MATYRGDPSDYYESSLCGETLELSIELWDASLALTEPFMHLEHGWLQEVSIGGVWRILFDVPKIINIPSTPTWLSRFNDLEE